tara:strand:+ start:1955 stop:4270 length:2316 start_codon:yes stop_codon:yes gene_type:complete
MIIGLENDIFSMFNMNLFGHDPIHDFRMSNRLNKPQIKTILLEIHDIYQRKKILTPLMGGLKEMPYDKKLSLSRTQTKSNKSQSKEKLQIDSKKVNIKSLVKEFSIEIMFLIGNLTSYEINSIKKKFPNNITDKIISSAIEKRYFDIKKGGKKTKKNKKIKTKKKQIKSKNKITKKKYKIRAGMGVHERNKFKRDNPEWETRGEGKEEEYQHPLTKAWLGIREARAAVNEMERLEASKKEVAEEVEKEVVGELAAEVADESKKIEELDKLLDISEDELNEKSSKELQLILDQLKKLDEELPDDLSEEITDKLAEKTEYISNLFDDKKAAEKKAEQVEKKAIQDEEFEKKRLAEEAEIDEANKKAEIDEEKQPELEPYLQLQEIQKNEDKAEEDEIYFKQQAEKEEDLQRENITGEELSNEIIKLFAKIGLNLCDENVLDNDLIKVQKNILEKFLETKDVSKRTTMPSIDASLEEGFIKYLRDKQIIFYEENKATTTELNEELKKIINENEDKKYIINNGAILTTSNLSKNIVGSATSIIDSASGGFGVSENTYPDTEVGNMDVMFTYKTHTKSLKKKVYHIKLKNKGKNYTVSINCYLPYTNRFSTEKRDGRPVESIKFHTGEFEIDPNKMKNENNKLVAHVAYFNALKILLKQVEECTYFDWDILSYNRDFLNQFIREYHTKAVGDLLQELTSILKFGGFEGHNIEIPIYKKGSKILKYGDILRLFLASDRPSAVRFMLFKLHLDPEFVNQLAYGGFYGPANNPKRYIIA